jgi:methylmalonyl-CoA mutase N-terminal domain/subunit
MLRWRVAPSAGECRMTQGTPRLPGDKPWIFRTYAGHSTAEASNRLYRNNLAKGQTGLSVAFDLPTQTGLDPDHPLARGEVGKLGVSISHIGDMRELFEALPLQQMNTSMTINATAAWLLALYAAVADEQGAPRPRCRAPSRTTSSRNTCRAAPTCSRRSPRSGSPATPSCGAAARCRSGTRSTCAPTTCRRPARRRCRRWRSRSPPP